MTILILAIILFMLIGINFIIYQAKWEPFFQNLRGLGSKLANSWEDAKQEVLQAEQENTDEKQTEKIPIFLRTALPLLYTLLFPAFIALVTVCTWSPFAQKNPLVLFFYVFAILLSLVFYVLQNDSPNFCIKFWLYLFISLVAEFSLAFCCKLLLEGYYFSSVNRMKYLGSLGLVFFLFIGTALQTQHNWLQWRYFSKIKQEDTSHEENNRFPDAPN